MLGGYRIEGAKAQTERTNDDESPQSRISCASLGIAAVALSDSLQIPGIGLVIMNVIALSFEFVSSSVQSIRLLYYEFMGKFFHGEGIKFKPFTIRPPKILAE